MSEFKTEYPVLYFNEYFWRNPLRLNERESEVLFTLEQTDVNNFQYISLHDHEKEIASLKEQLKREQECVDYYAWPREGEVWGGFYEQQDVIHPDDVEEINSCLMIGGKLARLTQARREK